MNSNIIFLVKKEYANLRKSERKVADLVLAGQFNWAKASLDSVAKASGVSQPSVIRFAKAIGLDSFTNLKMMMVEEGATSGKATIGHLYGFQIYENMEFKDVPADIIGTTIVMMENLLKNIDTKSLKAAVEAICQARTVAIFSVENSASIANDLLTKLVYLGINCISYSDYYNQCVAAKNLADDCVAIGISYSGYSRNTVESMKLAQSGGAKTIVMTNFCNSPILEYANIPLITGSEQFLYGEALYSRSTQMALVDMIYTGIILSDYPKYTRIMDESSRITMGKAYKIEEGE